jgi:outer membrane protein W
MRKRCNRFVTITLPVLLILTGTLPGASDSEPGPLGIGLNTGYGLFTENQYKGEIMAGLSLFYSIGKQFRLELRGVSVSSNVDATADGFSKGRLMAIPLQLSLQYRIRMNKRIIPYIGGGIGYYPASFSLDTEAEWNRLGFEVKDELDGSAGFHAGAGTDFLLTDKLMLNIDARYTFVSLSGTYSITEIFSGVSNSGDINTKFNVLMLSIGFNYFF